jgi:hypothetical protein
MKSTILSTLIPVFLIFMMASCKPDKDLDPDRGCFATTPLETISWAKDQLAYLQHPKSGPLREWYTRIKMNGI